MRQQLCRHELLGEICHPGDRLLSTTSDALCPDVLIRRADEAQFVADVRQLHVTPHIAQNLHARRRTSAVDGRTTRHAGYEVSQRKRKLVEEGFGWGKCVGLLRKLHHRGRETVGWIFTFTSAAYNLVRLRTLLAAP